MSNLKILIARLALALLMMLLTFSLVYFHYLLTLSVYLFAGFSAFLIFACPRPFWRWTLVKTGVITVFLIFGIFGLAGLATCRMEESLAV